MYEFWYNIVNIGLSKGSCNYLEYKINIEML